MNVRQREEDLKGAAALLSPIDEWLCDILLSPRRNTFLFMLERLSEDHYCPNFDVTDTKPNNNGIICVSST